MQFTRLIWAAFLMFVSASVPALADKRVALVIGNGSYQSVGRLPNPTRDAGAMAELFRKAGFEAVKLETNVDVTTMRRSLRAFADTAADADTAVVFFAGHGVEVGGRNYLVPIDAKLLTDIDVQDEAIDLDRVLELLSPVRRLKLVILDACRENPFSARMKLTTASRSVGRGLAPPTEQTSNMLVAYAARAGAVAADGDGRNSPFTTALLKHLTQPGLDVRIALGMVHDEVLVATGHKQEPFLYGALGGGTLALSPNNHAPLSSAPAAVTPPTSNEQDEVAWSMIEETSDPKLLENFITRFPQSQLRARAADALQDLKRRQMAALGSTQGSMKPVASSSIQTTPSEPPPKIEGGWWGTLFGKSSGQEVAAVTPVVPSTLPVSPCGSASDGVVLASLAARVPEPLTRQEECALKTKDEFKECEKCPEMVVVPAGSFLMGSPKSEEGREGNEGPQHEVRIAKSFAVGKFDVSFDEWNLCVTEGGCNGYAPKGLGYRSARHPVIEVSWNDAEAYAEWLSKRTGRAYRLLSEAEWEYAARGGSTTPFWWGTSISKEQANFRFNHELYDGRYTTLTVPVSSFAPNPFGVYTVHGNVWQWVKDCYQDSYIGAPSDGSAWTSGACEKRVLRGGSFMRQSHELRSASRTMNFPGMRDNEFGFRIARTLSL